MSTTTALEVKTVAELAQQPAEYQGAVQKIVISHAVNELYGAQVFDEPAIQLAPTPYAKWLACRIAMEEYHHHVRFKALADERSASRPSGWTRATSGRSRSSSSSSRPGRSSA